MRERGCVVAQLVLPGGKEHLDPEAFDSHQLVSDGWLQAELVGALVLALLGMLVQHMLERRRRTHPLAHRRCSSLATQRFKR